MRGRGARVNQAEVLQDFVDKLVPDAHLVCLNSPPAFDPINCTSAILRTAEAAFFVRVQRALVINSKLLARLDIAQGNKEDMVVKDLHVGVRLA